MEGGGDEETHGMRRALGVQDTDTVAEKTVTELKMDRRCTLVCPNGEAALFTDTHLKVGLNRNAAAQYDIAAVCWDPRTKKEQII